MQSTTHTRTQKTRAHIKVQLCYTPSIVLFSIVSLFTTGWWLGTSSVPIYTIHTDSNVKSDTLYSIHRKEQQHPRFGKIFGEFIFANLKFARTSALLNNTFNFQPLYFFMALLGTLFFQFKRF